MANNNSPLIAPPVLPADVTIRPFEQADLPHLMQLDSITRRLPFDLARGGHAQVICFHGRPTGYSSALPLPGLPSHLELQLCIQPEWRRRGFGSLLLQHFLPALKEADVQTVSRGFSTLDDPVARLLLHAGFYKEHEEWEMARELQDMPLLALPGGMTLRTYPLNRAISEFRRLYEVSFAALPSYQPYTNNAEVAQELDSDQDLLFLVNEGQAIGFAWLRHVDDRLGEIEPMGLAAGHQGKGLGKILLLAALHKLAEMGYAQARLGVWTDNARAISLYRRLGFQRVGTQMFLALNLATG